MKVTLPLPHKATVGLQRIPRLAIRRDAADYFDRPNSPFVYEMARLE